MVPRGAATLALVAALAFALSGCGGGGHGGAGSGGSGAADQSAVRHTITTYLSGLADGDGRAVCSALSASEITLMRKQGAKLHTTSCPQIMDSISGLLTAGQKSILKRTAITRVSITGDTARVTLHGESSAIQLIRSGQQWLINGGTR